MYYKILLSVIIFLSLYSCQNKNTENTITFQPEYEIEEFPDSSFFSNIICMNYYKNKLYILDKKRGDIVTLDSSLKNMEYACKHGEAPYETIWPFTFNVLNDTVFVIDFGTKSMKKFYHGELYGHFQLSNANENRFSLNDSSIFLSANTDSTSFLIIDKQHPEKQIPKGKIIREKTPFKTIISNKKHILFDKNEGIFSIADCYPYVEQYDTNGKYIKTFDLSSIPIINKAIKKSKENQNKEKSVYIYIRDAYIANNCLYILCASQNSSNNYQVNTILELSIKNEMKHTSTYMLPNGIYSSFCVSDTHIFASQETPRATIQKFKLSHDKI